MGLAARHNPIAVAGARGENTMIAHLVGAGWRDQGCKFFEQFQGFEDHVRGSVAPAVLEAVE